MSAELLADLARVKAVFQLRAVVAALGLRDSDTRRMAETAQTGSVRSTGSADPEGIAQ